MDDRWELWQISKRRKVMQVYAKAWKERTLSSPEELNKQVLIETLLGESCGIRIPEFYSPESCEHVVSKLRKVAGTKGRRYKAGPKNGGSLNIGTVLDIPPHWEFEYVLEDENAWLDYFSRVSPTIRLRKRIFSEIGDPVEYVSNMIGKVWGKPVQRVRHPKFKRKLYAGLIRSGAPKLHFDNASFDLPGTEILGQAGANVYLKNFAKGGDLTTYRVFGKDKGFKLSSGMSTIGNYDLSPSLVEGAESRTVPCRQGDFILTPNHLLHEVTKGMGPEEDRLVLSFHLIWMKNGSLAIFS
jgi:hypothetical protein